MRVIEVPRDTIPSDFTPEHVRVLEHGHERGVVSAAADKRNGPAQRVLGFVSGLGVGVTIFGGMTFVDSTGRNGNGPVRIRITD